MASWFEKQPLQLPNEQTPPRTYKKYGVNKSKSFDESILIPKNSPTCFAANGSYSSSYASHSYTCTKDKKLHPLFPLPSPLDSPHFSTRSSSGSSSSSFQFNDDEQGISPLFSPLRFVQSFFFVANPLLNCPYLIEFLLVRHWICPLLIPVVHCLFL